MSVSQQQYLRLYSLLVGTTPGAVGGPALDLSDLQFKFSISKSITPGAVPSSCDTTIYNPAPSTVAKIPRPTNYSNGGAILIQVGWQGLNASPPSNALQTLYSGSIMQRLVGREDNVNTFVRVISQDGDYPYNTAVSNRTLPAGWQAKDVWNVHASAFAQAVPFGGPQAPTPAPAGLSQSKASRGKVIFGRTKEKVREWFINNNTGGSWTDNSIEAFVYGQKSNKTVIILNSETGMIGVPVATVSGVIVRALINTNFQLGGRIQLTESVNPYAFDPESFSAQYVPPAALVSTTGLYYIYGLRHVGDTRGNDWYTELTCWAIDPVTGFADGFNPNSAMQTATS